MTGKSPDVHLTGTTTINGGFLAGNVKLAKWYPSSNHLSTVYLRIYLAIYTNYLSSCPASLCTNLMQIGHPHAHMQIECIYAPIYIYIYWDGNSTVPKNIKGFGYISSRCHFFCLAHAPSVCTKTSAARKWQI